MNLDKEYEQVDNKLYDLQRKTDKVNELYGETQEYFYLKMQCKSLSMYLLALEGLISLNKDK